MFCSCTSCVRANRQHHIIYDIFSPYYKFEPVTISWTYFHDTFSCTLHVCYRLMMLITYSKAAEIIKLRILWLKHGHEYLYTSWRGFRINNFSKYCTGTHGLLFCYDYLLMPFIRANTAYYINACSCHLTGFTKVWVLTPKQLWKITSKSCHLSIVIVFCDANDHTVSLTWVQRLVCPTLWVNAMDSNNSIMSLTAYVTLNSQCCSKRIQIVPGSTVNENRKENSEMFENLAMMICFHLIYHLPWHTSNIYKGKRIKRVKLTAFSRCA